MYANEPSARKFCVLICKCDIASVLPGITFHTCADNQICYFTFYSGYFNNVHWEDSFCGFR